MAKLTITARKAIPGGEFALPGRKVLRNKLVRAIGYVKIAEAKKSKLGDLRG